MNAEAFSKLFDSNNTPIC